MNFYQTAGLALAIISGVCLMILLLQVLPQALREQRKSDTRRTSRNRKASVSRRPVHIKKQPERTYPPEFLSEIPQAYQSAGSIKGMVKRLKQDWQNDSAGERAARALEYLEYSRYKDYETALFVCLSDGTPECEMWLREVLELEICTKNFKTISQDDRTREGEERDEKE